MASLNRHELIGHLGNDPELRYMPNGTPTASISVATTEIWKDKDTGEKKERTDWHRVIFFSRLAEVAQEYLKQGSQVFVSGKSRTRKWTDSQGVDHYTTELIASEMQMLGKKPTGEPLERAPDMAAPPLDREE